MAKWVSERREGGRKKGYRMEENGRRMRLRRERMVIGRRMEEG